MARYSKKAGDKVGEVLHEQKEGKLKIGQSNKKVTSRKQAIAIALSEARKEGAKVPAKKTADKKSSQEKTAPKKKLAKKAANKNVAKKTASPKKAAKKSPSK